MKPVIGIPLRYQKLVDNRAIVYMSERLRRTVQTAGGFVYSISPVQNLDNIHTKGNEFPELTEAEKEDIEISLNMCDGIIFPGGIKFTPYDRYLLERAIDKKIPVLGICLGMQMISCYKKDIDLRDVQSSINHYQESDFELGHSVKISKESKLFELIGKEEIMVNSFHKRCIGSNELFLECAFSDDGIVEGIEYCTNGFVVGIQWHPEISYEFDENSKKLIDGFIEVCKKHSLERSV